MWTDRTASGGLYIVVVFELLQYSNIQSWLFMESHTKVIPVRSQPSSMNSQAVRPHATAAFKIPDRSHDTPMADSQS